MNRTEMQTVFRTDPGCSFLIVANNPMLEESADDELILFLATPKLIEQTRKAGGVESALFDFDEQMLDRNVKPTAGELQATPVPIRR